VPHLLIGVLAVGVAVAKNGLAERVARHILTGASGRAPRVYLQLALAMPVLAFLLPSATTRSEIPVHIYEEAFNLARVPAGAGVVKAVMLALSSINRLASTALLVASRRSWRPRSSAACRGPDGSRSCTTRSRALPRSSSTSAVNVSTGEILRFGFWMTLVAYVAIVCVALPYWAAMGQPLVPGGLGTSG
jgi:di/tricarboxylate transporter